MKKLFGRYSGVVWPKASQMNLIAAILNNICQGTGMKISSPHIPSPAEPLLFSIDEAFLGQFIDNRIQGMFMWNPIARSMGPGGCMVARTWVNAELPVPNQDLADGLYSLRVELGPSPSASVVTGVALGAAADGDVSYIPIYEINTGKIVRDYRGAFVVPAYE